MSAAEAHRITEIETPPLPKAIALAPEIPEALQVTVPQAYAAVKALMEPDLRYHVAFLEDDGTIFRRFMRRWPTEAWIVATPVDEDGKTLRGRKLIVCAIAAKPTSVEEQKTIDTTFKAELAALVAADEEE